MSAALALDVLFTLAGSNRGFLADVIAPCEKKEGDDAAKNERS
jgi:hypothetical protein